MNDGIWRHCGLEHLPCQLHSQMFVGRHLIKILKLIDRDGLEDVLSVFVSKNQGVVLKTHGVFYLYPRDGWLLRSLSIEI